MGSIPAPAGEPPGIPKPRQNSTVYPRACGGTRALELVRERHQGLSPRLRGNLEYLVAWAGCDGSIPAPAGEPPPTGPPMTVLRVYPRACGGTLEDEVFFLLVGGLSPRLRGNRGSEGPPTPPPRSIPAPAGEPWRTRCSSSSSEVYPRACGGTEARKVRPHHHRGLSPRLRGNPIASGSGAVSSRSIPAPAGEPGFHGVCQLAFAVYPRACGGTYAQKYQAWLFTCLSPRLRGNHWKGSIRSPVRIDLISSKCRSPHGSHGSHGSSR